MSNRCSTCYFHDKCGSDIKCEDYAPIGDELSDDAIDDMIESNRDSFYRDWFKYIYEDGVC